MSGNIAVIYAGDLEPVAEVFGVAAARLAAQVRLLHLAKGENEQSEPAHPRPELRDLEWADGIAFGTPAGERSPDPGLMQFIEGTGPLWSSGQLYDKVVTVFTDEPEHIAPGAVLHPIYGALYRWGAAIVGPREFELELEARPGQPSEGSSLLSPARLRTARYRALRLARLASVLAEDHARRERLQL